MRTYGKVYNFDKLGYSSLLETYKHTTLNAAHAAFIANKLIAACQET